MVKHLHKDQVQVKVTVDKPVYLLGDTLNGTIDLNIKADNIPGQLYVKFMGIEKTNQLDLVSNFFTMKRRFYTKKIRVSDLGSPMPIIETQKKFSFIIPEDRPPSFCINYWKDVQCRIFYVIAIYFTNQEKNVIYKPSKSHKIGIFIIKRANPIPQPIKASNASHVVKKCCFSGGKSIMSVVLNKQEFEIDDLAETFVTIDNTKSNLSITQLRMSVQARLEVRYKSNKASNRSYFPFCHKVFKESVDGGQKKQVTLQMTLSPSEEKYKIYPQSSIESRDIQYFYTLCVEAFFQFAFNPNTQKSYQVMIPIKLFQLQKRNQAQNSYQQQSRVQSFSSPNQQFLQGEDQLEINKIEFADKDIEGYGPQDGYFGPPRKGSFEHSMESVELRGQVIYSNKTETEPLEHSYSVDGKGTRNWKKPKAQMKQGVQKSAAQVQKNKGLQKQMARNFSARKLFGKK